MDKARIAVVGAGVIGLSTAVCISKLVPGCSITIISDKFTPDTTSDVAAGMLIPHIYPGERGTSAPLSDMKEANGILSTKKASCVCQCHVQF